MTFVAELALCGSVVLAYSACVKSFNIGQGKKQAIDAKPCSGY